ncbi:hypothetical protein CROQUDRAFT_663774 [Cronartium quercuum f. sp. fusiforme G11]|uniref:Uncharacterized protein n=1 Tax=Cronartium quercuum f. sp. fusiforme G11 TaxID=708437 RepID=A0A9P6T8H6_9BASI|nr:hypothetical protein CROQUDRAFT_663774 [Cronartium quercuum f. sp. fusiforme G11]
MYASNKGSLNLVGFAMGIGSVIGQFVSPHLLTPKSLAVASDSPRIEVNCTQAYTTLGSDDAANATAVVCKSADSPKATLCSPQSCYHYSTCHGCRKIVTNENNVEEISDVFYDRVVCEKDYYLANRTTEESMDSICTDKNFDTYICNGHYVGFAHCHNCTEVLDPEDETSLS